VAIVGLDDLLHKTVANDVLLIEINEFDTRNFLKDVFDFDQTGDTFRWQIDLGDIPRYDGL
jgi:hypothetical protein